MGWILFFGTIIAFGFLLAMTQDRSSVQRRQCSKDSSKLCPYTVEITHMGGMKASGHFGCCKIIDDFKALNDMCASAEPGKAYGEFSFSPEVIAQARRDKPRLDAIDSSGPRE